MPERLKSGKIKITFERTPQFRTIQVDGAWGGVTPSGAMIAMSFYHERAALPSGLTITVKEARKANEVRTGAAGIVRVLETEARMTPTVARAVASWLITKADEADAFLKAVASAESAEVPAGESDSSE